PVCPLRCGQSRNHSRSRIDNHHIDEEWTAAVRARFKQHPELVMQRYQSSDPAADIHSNIIGVLIGDLQASMGKRLPGTGYRKMLVWIVPTNFFAIHKRRGIKMLDLPPKMDAILADIVALDLSNARLSLA